MKRIFSLVLAAAMLTASLCACGNSGSQNSTNPAGESSSGPSASIPTQESSAQPSQVDLAAFAQTVQRNYSFPNLDRLDPADEDFGTIMLENTYPGLGDMDLEQIEIYLAMISFSGGELALVQAKNADDAAKVKGIFDARITAKTTEGPGNYPEEVEMWQHNAAVVSNGNYIMLVNSNDSEAVISEFNALFA